MSTTPDPGLSDTDRRHLRRCVELARIALEAGDAPFGSVLVGPAGEVFEEGRNHEHSDNATRHPELDLARWAGMHLSPEVRAASTVYTSGEHCAMCSAAHAWVGLGRIVYAASTAQLVGWRAGWGAPESPVRPLAVNDVAPGIPVSGPDPSSTAELRDLHERAFRRG